MVKLMISIILSKDLSVRTVKIIYMRRYPCETKPDNADGYKIIVLPFVKFQKFSSVLGQG